MTTSQTAEKPVDGHSMVLVTINGRPYEVPKGKVPVQQLKKVAGIPAVDELAELKEGKVIPLPDDGYADAERCDVFTSYPRSCSSS